MIDLQCFSCIAKWFSYTYTHICVYIYMYIYMYVVFLRLFSIIDYYKKLNIVQHSLYSRSFLFKSLCFKKL